MQGVAGSKPAAPTILSPEPSLALWSRNFSNFVPLLGWVGRAVDSRRVALRQARSITNEEKPALDTLVQTYEVLGEQEPEQAGAGCGAGLARDV